MNLITSPRKFRVVDALSFAEKGSDRDKVNSLRFELKKQGYSKEEILEMPLEKAVKLVRKDYIDWYKKTFENVQGSISDLGQNPLVSLGLVKPNRKKKKKKPLVREVLDLLERATV